MDKLAIDGLSQNLYEPNYFSLLFGLLTVICLIYITGIIYKKLTGIKLSSDIKLNNIEIVSSASLGQNKNLYIIKVNSKYCLIGATQNSINHIKDIDTNDIEVIAKEGENNA